MSLKSRFLRIGLIVVGVLAFAGYFAFSTFFFDPFESDLDFDVAVLAPRDVDFYVSKAELGALFEPFPELAAKKELAVSPAWNAWTSSPQCAELLRETRLEEQLAALKTQLAGLPFGMDLLDVVGGSDLAIAGYFKGKDLQQADWAVYGRANWMGKLAASALRHPGLIGLEKQGLTAVQGDDSIALSGGQLPRTLYVTRLRDVVVIATKPELAKKAHELELKQYAESLHQSANYHDWIQKRTRGKARDEIEIYVNTLKLMENLGFKGEFPDTKSQDFTPAFIGRWFQAGSVKNVTGLIGLDGGVQADLHGEFTSESITREQEKFYRTRGFDRAQIMAEAANLAPADCALFVYLHAGMGDFLRQVLASMEPAMRQTIEDAFRSTGKYQNLEQLVAQIDGAVKDRAVLLVRPNDYGFETGGPPHTGDPVPAVALVLWTKDAKQIVDVRETIGNNGSKFGLKGRTETEVGFFKYFEAGYETREYWSQTILGTGHVATVNAGEITIITNVSRMMAHILKVQTQGGDRYPRLADDPRFEALVESALPRSNLLVWANSQYLGPILRDQARFSATGTPNVDWTLPRQQERKKHMTQSGITKAWDALTQDEQNAVDDAIEPRMRELEEKYKREQSAKAGAESEVTLRYVEAFDCALAMLALDPKSWDLTIRAPFAAPAAEPGP